MRGFPNPKVYDEPTVAQCVCVVGVPNYDCPYFIYDMVNEHADER